MSEARGAVLGRELTEAELAGVVGGIVLREPAKNPATGDTSYVNVVVLQDGYLAHAWID